MDRRLLNVSDSVFNSARKAVLRNGLGVFCRVYRSLGSLGNSRTLKGGNFNYFAAELAGQLLGVYLIAVLADNIHHIDGDNYRYAELHKLCGQIKVSFQVCSVDNVQYRVGTLGNEVISCNNLFKRVGRQGVNTRKVGDYNAVVLFKLAFLFLYRNARPVTYKLIGAGKCVEQGGFTAVRVARKGNSDTHSFSSLFLQLALANFKA